MVDLNGAVQGKAVNAPVITAHPSEVRRKSVLDRQSAIARGLEAFDRARTDSDRAAIERHFASLGDRDLEVA